MQNRMVLVFFLAIHTLVFAAVVKAQTDEEISEAYRVLNGAENLEYDPRLRSQLLVLAPLASMMSPLTVGRENVADVLEEIAALKAYGQSSFDAHPDLETASRDLISYFVLSEHKVTPVHGAVVPDFSEFQPTGDLEFDLALAFVFRIGEMVKQESVARWQEDYDERCRKVYRKIYPLLRDTSLGETPLEPPVRVQGNFAKNAWVYLEIVNQSGVDLTNVSLRIKLSTIDGSASDHYYFFETWQKHTSIPLRVAMDWRRVGASMTTGARTDIVSDQFIADGVQDKIEDHVPTAGDVFLGQIEQQIGSKKKLQKAINRLQQMGGPLARYPGRLEKRNELLRLARGYLQDVVSSLDERISKQSKQLREVKKSLRQKNSLNRFGRSRTEQQRDSLTESIAKLKQEKAEWMRGDR